MHPNDLRALVKECVLEVLQENLMEGFDPLSQGPNIPQENPYPAWNNAMRKLEEEEGQNSQPTGETFVDHPIDPLPENNHGRYAQLAGALEEGLELTATGQEDDWSRPVYQDQHGRIYVDINLGKGEPSIHTVTDEGEPMSPVRNYTIVSGQKQDRFANALCPRCKNSKPELMKKTAGGKMSCTSCHWEDNPGEPYKGVCPTCEASSKKKNLSEIDSSASDDEIARHIAKVKYGSTFQLTNKVVSPSDPSITFYIFNKPDGTSYTGWVANKNGVWLHRKYSTWEPYPIKSPKVPPTPEMLATKAERKRLRQAKEQELKQRRDAFFNTFFKERPNMQKDMMDISTGNEEIDTYINLARLSEREKRIVSLVTKGYTPQDIGTVFHIVPTRVSQLYRRGIEKIKFAIKSGEIK